LGRKFIAGVYQTKRATSLRCTRRAL